MYLTYAGQFLDDKGAFSPLRGRAKAMADFHAGVIAYATDFDDSCVTCRDVSSTRRALPVGGCQEALFSGFEDAVPAIVGFGSWSHPCLAARRAARHGRALRWGGKEVD